MKNIYRVVFHDDAGQIKVTAPTHYEDAYITAEAYKGTIYREEKTQPVKDGK